MITLADVHAQLEKMPMLTGKQASTYICGPKAYGELLDRCTVEPSDCRSSGITFMGFRIYQSEYVPDDGKFYPADYLESQTMRMVNA